MIGAVASVYVLERLGYVHPGTADYIVAAIGGLLPDVDHSSSVMGSKTKILSFLKHRGLTHSILGAGIVYFLMQFLFTRYLTKAVPLINYVMIGYISHIFLDMLTPSGVSLFYPFKKRIKILPLIKTGSAAETVFMLLMVAAMSYFYLKK
jgi:inner membrane protein